MSCSRIHDKAGWKPTLRTQERVKPARCISQGFSPHAPKPQELHHERRCFVLTTRNWPCSPLADWTMRSLPRLPPMLRCLRRPAATPWRRFPTRPTCSLPRFARAASAFQRRAGTQEGPGLCGGDWPHASRAAPTNLKSEIPNLKSRSPRHPRLRASGKLGEGGMGAVYKALHTRSTRSWPSRCCRPIGCTTRRPSARFEREMEAVGKLEHPHIVRAYGRRRARRARTSW